MPQFSNDPSPAFKVKVLISEPSMQLFSLGKGKYYKEDSALNLDVGPFTAALEFASEKKAVVG